MFTATIQEKNDYARRACADFAWRVTVALSPRHDPASSFGTGILLQNDCGVPFLLTARHLLDDGAWQPIKTLVQGMDRELRDIGDAVYFAPGLRGDERIDVAVVRLRPQFHDLLRPGAAGLEVLADDASVAPTDTVFLTGYPRFLAFPDPGRPRDFFVPSIFYVTTVEGFTENGLLKVYWRDAEMGFDAPPFPHLDVQPGKVMRLGDAKGISGGGLWRVRVPGPDKVWSPSSHAKLIGIAVAWNTVDTEFAESASGWAGWVRDVASRLR
jgi:hypothetical protein